MNKISVIIPIYNTTEFLDDCIGSVSEQTYRNLEILLINDGSDEECTKKIISLAKNDERIEVHHLSRRKGVGCARNYGLEIATGQYIYFLDSDDYISKETLQELVENIGDYELISGQIEEINKEPSEVGNSKTEIVVDKDKTRQFNNKSVLHRLISKAFIDKYQLRFNEDVRCYSDLAFVVPLMINITKAPQLLGCIYFKRFRNDPISNPSLMQSDMGKIIIDFITIYNQLRDKYQQNDEAQSFLDKQFLNLYRNEIIGYASIRKFSQVEFDQLRSAVSKLDKKQLAKMPLMIRSELKQLIKGKQNLFSKLLKVHVNLGLLRRGYRSRTKMYLQLYRSLFTKMPMKENYVVFESFLGKNYSDSPKYIYEYMQKYCPEYKFVWIYADQRREIPGNPKQVKRFSFAYYYYLGRSKYWVSNSRLPKHLNKRKGNIYIQTWHGTPLKKLVFDMKDVYSANPNYKKDFYEQSRRWDYLVSANQYSSDIFRRAFKYSKPMLEYGYPRNDIMYAENRDQIAKSIKAKLGIPAGKRVILYAPTWRDDEYYGAGKYKFSLKLDLERMRNELGEDYVVILRMHYFIADNLDIGDYSGFAFNFSKYDDIADLYLISDILITDYSSVFFDYANLRRPILFFTYDLEKYRDTLRGFYIDIEREVPGPLLKTSGDVINAIKNIEKIEEEYRGKYKAFTERFCSWEKGVASEQIVKHVFGPKK